MKTKIHRFVIDVETVFNRASAYNGILFAFAKRDPDQFKFHLRVKKPRLAKK